MRVINTDRLKDVIEYCILANVPTDAENTIEEKWNDWIQTVIDRQPTVEVVPKEQYEARLKADMVAMLEQLDLEIKEQIAFMGDGEETNGMKRADNLVKDKISAFKQSIWQDNYNGKK